jgi:hypothetical protein
MSSSSARDGEMRMPDSHFRVARPLRFDDGPIPCSTNQFSIALGWASSI